MGNKEISESEPEVNKESRNMEALQKTENYISMLQNKVETLDRKITLKKEEIRKIAMIDMNRSKQMTSDVQMWIKERENTQKHIRDLNLHRSQTSHLATTIETQEHIASLNEMNDNLMTRLNVDDVKDINEDSSKARQNLNEMLTYAGLDFEDPVKEKETNDRLWEDIMNESSTNVYIPQSAQNSKQPSNITTVPTTTKIGTVKSTLFDDIMGL